MSNYILRRLQFAFEISSLQDSGHTTGSPVANVVLRNVLQVRLSTKAGNEAWSDGLHAEGPGSASFDCQPQKSARTSEKKTIYIRYKSCTYTKWN